MNTPMAYTVKKVKLIKIDGYLGLKFTMTRSEK